jgi:XTP/dITP diphosphohydrolase
MARTIHRLLLASGNPGKLVELRSLLKPQGVEVTGLDGLDPRPDDVPETGTTFRANAAIKAIGYGLATGIAAIADDSGLCVDALDGQPGVFSARFSGESADAASNNALLLERLDSVATEARSAHFACAIALFAPAEAIMDELLQKAAGIDGIEPFTDPDSGHTVLVATGRTSGTILRSSVGEGGFGYDPLFLSDDLGVTFAEGSMEQKAAVSHRGRALRVMAAVFDR